jgi:hypothetical protein
MIRLMVWFLALVGLAGPSLSAPQRCEHVLLIGLDGARPEALQIEGLTHLPRLIREGTVCWNAQAVRPTVTQVNWASMLAGAAPERTGISKHPVTEEELAGMKVQVPTVFEVVVQEGGTAVGFFGHWKLYPLETDTPGARFIHSPYEAENVVGLAADYLRHEKPTFCFVWMGNLDGLGHKYGWLSPEQQEGVRRIDAAIGELLEALQEAGMLQTTLILISADHGGHERGHGEGTPEDATIPWIAWGPAIRRGHVIGSSFSTYDTAATILHALGMPRPQSWDGRPVEEAFEPVAEEQRAVAP